MDQIVVIAGPTASGKTALSVALAKALGGEVISADSMQLYRGMDIGTAKVTSEEMDGVPHHMIDVAEPEEAFSVARYVEEADPILQDILARGKTAVIAGGTGLYVDALVKGRTFAPYPETGKREALEREADALGMEAMLERLKTVDPDSGARLHLSDRKRILRALEVYAETGKTITQHNLETRAIPPRYDALTLALAFEQREDMWSRIDRRVDQMMDQGLVAEVQGLLDSGVPAKCTAMQAIGYKEMAAALLSHGDVRAAAEEIQLRSRQYAKRQLTWFKRNKAARWLLWGREPDFAAALQTSTEYMEEFGLV